MRLLAGILALLLLQSMVHSCVGNTGVNTVVVFKGGETKVSHKGSSDHTQKNTPLAFGIPAFVGGVLNNSDFFAVLCDARYDGSSSSNFIGPAVRTSYWDYNVWSDAQEFITTTPKSGENAVLRNVTAVIKEDKIYAIATHLDKSNTAQIQSDGSTSHWDTVMFVGTVRNSTGSRGKSVIINWEEEKSLKSLLTSTSSQPENIYFVGGVGNGVVMKNGTIVLPIQITNKEYVESASIIYSSDDGSTWHMGGKASLSTCDGSVAEFGRGKLLFSVRVDSSAREVYESDDMGVTWKPSPVFTEVWGNNKIRKGAGSQGSVISVPVDGKDILLFSHPLNTKENHIRETLQLWVSDGRHIVCVGTINGKEKEKKTGNSILLHVDDNLFVTHEINPSGPFDKAVAANKQFDSTIAFIALPQLFNSAKNTVRAWWQVDTLLQTRGIPTKGLVGFLENTKDNTVWADMYNCVNATVKSATNVDGGFRFSGGAGSGAQWPVASQGQNQVYKFTEKEFTLSAKVTIHSTSGAEGILLLGASKNSYNGEILIGLGYTQDKKWCKLSGKGSKDVTGFAFELDTEYHVALTLADGVAVVYVDGLNIANVKGINQFSAEIDHFEIGGMGTSSSAEGGSCTVTNVMLFNRSLKQAEIAHLSNIGNNDDLNEPMTTEKAERMQDNRNTPSTIKHKGVTGNPKTVSSTETKAASVTEKQTFINKKGESKPADRIVRDHRNGNLEEQMNLADGVAVLFGFAPIMSLTCFIILLLVF